MYLAARERGIRIPDELSVIGFDDMEFARVLDPPLTTVALDAELLGSTSFELLELRLNGKRTRKRVVLPPSSWCAGRPEASAPARCRGRAVKIAAAPPADHGVERPRSARRRRAEAGPSESSVAAAHGRCRGRRG